MYLSDLQPAMKPSDAFAHIAHRKTERVADRRAGRAHHDVAADAVPAGHPAADSGRALQPQDRRLPALHARVQRRLPGLRHRRARPGGRGLGRRRPPALLRRLRHRRLIRRAPPAAPLSAGSAAGAAHGVAEAAVDVGDLGADAGGQVRQQEGRDVADIVDGDVAAQIGALRRTQASSLPKSLMPEAASVLIGPAEMPLTRTPRAPRLLRQEAHARFQRGLGQAHRVVVGHVARTAPR